jgi:branched-subunit amino acid aminotransferase/4-amino-4-deoxychorismate lyase
LKTKFRDIDHYKRLINSTKIYRMFVDINEEGFMEITKDIIRKNDLQEEPLRIYKTRNLQGFYLERAG